MNIKTIVMMLLAVVMNMTTLTVATAATTYDSHDTLVHVVSVRDIERMWYEFNMAGGGYEVLESKGWDIVGLEGFTVDRRGNVHEFTTIPNTMISTELPKNWKTIQYVTFDEDDVDGGGIFAIKNDDGSVWWYSPGEAKY